MIIGHTICQQLPMICHREQYTSYAKRNDGEPKIYAFCILSRFGKYNAAAGKSESALRRLLPLELY